jgi:hypothetical protein
MMMMTMKFWGISPEKRNLNEQIKVDNLPTNFYPFFSLSGTFRIISFPNNIVEYIFIPFSLSHLTLFALAETH